MGLGFLESKDGMTKLKGIRVMQRIVYVSRFCVFMICNFLIMLIWLVKMGLGFIYFVIYCLPKIVAKSKHLEMEDVN